jgi:hypothetical protein
MNAAEYAYLLMSIGAVLVFVVALAGVTEYSNAGPEARARSAEDERRHAGGAPRHA